MGRETVLPEGLLSHPAGFDSPALHHPVRCRIAGCGAAAVWGGFRCLAHLGPDDELEAAERYAVASALYYGRPDADPLMTDPEFDGLCAWLLERQAWKRHPWLEREALIAGTGYDLARLPEDLRALAASMPARDRDRWSTEANPLG